MQNQSRDSFPSETKKNPNNYMEITLRSGRELHQRKKKYEKMMTEKKQKVETGKKNELNSLEITEGRRKSKVQQE